MSFSSETSKPLDLSGSKGWQVPSIPFKWVRFIALAGVLSVGFVLWSSKGEQKAGAETYMHTETKTAVSDTVKNEGSEGSNGLPYTPPGALLPQTHVHDLHLPLLSDQRPPDDKYSPQNYVYPTTDSNKRANAAIILLTREQELVGLREVLISFEEKFNKKYKYPYLLFNDVEFSPYFRAEIEKLVSTPVTYVKVNPQYWEPPSFVNITKAQEEMKKMEEARVMYGGSFSYRKMCRFFSGTMFQHPELLKYDYYWRLDSSNVKFHCRMDFDPFVYLMDRNMVYSFTIILHEFQNTCPTLWQTTVDYLNEKGSAVPGMWMNWFTDNGKAFNGHHFWSNFEIGSVKFFAGPQYQDYFNYLDKTGGFFYERWGDAPVHSLGLGLYAKKEEVHWFNEIGYSHAPFTHCPNQPQMMDRCDCFTGNLVDDIPFSGLHDFLILQPRTLNQSREDANAVVQELRTMLADAKDCAKPWEVNDGGMWAICSEPKLEPPNKCTVLSFSVKHASLNMDFEQEMMVRHGCSVHYFNQWKVPTEMEKQVQDWEHQKRVYALRWHQLTLSHVDADSQRREPFSHMIVQERRLSTAMRIAGVANKTVDVVKFDVEGDEWAVLLDMVQSGALDTVKFLMFEVHLKADKVWKYSYLIPRVLDGLREYFELVHSTKNPYGIGEQIADWQLHCCHKLVFRNKAFK